MCVVPIGLRAVRWCAKKNKNTKKISVNLQTSKVSATLQGSANTTERHYSMSYMNLFNCSSICTIYAVYILDLHTLLKYNQDPYSIMPSVSPFHHEPLYQCRHCVGAAAVLELSHSLKILPHFTFIKLGKHFIPHIVLPAVEIPTLYIVRYSGRATADCYRFVGKVVGHVL